MELTGIAICASLIMAAATACAFIWAVKKEYFRDIEETKYQVFWSDLEDIVNHTEEENPHANADRK
jgi:cbb3-type cytochrome oxidase maturation protein